jgi:hypothetical protein
MIQYQDYPGEYVKKFEDETPDTFVWVSRTPSSDPEYIAFQTWLDDGNTLLPAPLEPGPVPVTPVIVVDDEFLQAVQSASTVNDVKQAILAAAQRAQPAP